jgi:hypothetical protein
MRNDRAETMNSEATTRFNVSKQTSRSLTHDEKKAAEAAFQHQPFNPSWSQAAWHVYEGILQATRKSNDTACLSPVQGKILRTSEEGLNSDTVPREGLEV